MLYQRMGIMLLCLHLYTEMLYLNLKSPTKQLETIYLFTTILIHTMAQVRLCHCNGLGMLLFYRNILEIR